MPERFHSVSLDAEKCRGCTNCIKRCPTEAIRVRDGKARIDVLRCIDCGECIRTCENHAKAAVTDSLADLSRFRYKIALVAPSLYAQFKGVPVNRVMEGLLQLGFDEVAEVAVGAELVTVGLRRYLSKPQEHRPLISSACPAIVRLIQVRFPSLIPHIVPISSPVQVLAKNLRSGHVQKLGLRDSELGLFFITPCPAKTLAIHEPVAEKRLIDGAISMQEIYGQLKRILPQVSGEGYVVKASGSGLGWARAGGENQALAVENHLAVDGIHNVLQVFEEIEMDRLSDVDYVEALACEGGCIGGPLVVENPFVARVRMRKLAEKSAGPIPDETVRQALEMYQGGELFLDGPIEPRRVMHLDEDMGTAIAKLELLERTLAMLPGLDCGSCGSPNCRALAEDVVQGQAVEADCVFKMREELSDLAQRLVDLARKVPPAMGKEYAERGDEQ